MKTCPCCKNTFPKNNEYFYSRRNGKDVSPYCKKCTQEQSLRRQRELKALAVEYKGGKCYRCGYDKYIGALEFHHKDPGAKDFTIAHSKNTSFDKVKDELDKCILLCANCHREIHNEIRNA